MTAPSEDIIEKVRQWAAFGDEDMSVARHTLSMADKCPYRLVAYHAQQCVEKYLKAYLVFREIDFPFTHNIARLLELCSKHCHSESQRAIEIAARVRETIRAALDVEGTSL